MVQDIKDNPTNTMKKLREEENARKREEEAKEKELADRRRREYERMIAKVEKEAPQRNAEREDKAWRESADVRKQQKKAVKNRIGY